MEVIQHSPDFQENFESIENNPLNLNNEEKEALIIFREAVKGIQNLNCPLEDDFLIRFLRAKSNNIEKSLKMITVYYDVRQENLHLFDIPTETYRRIYQKGGLMVLKNRDRKGRQILYCRASAFAPYEFTDDEMAAATALMVEEMTRIEETQKKGCCFIMDHTGFTFAQARAAMSQFSIKKAKMSLKLLQGGYPIKMKGGYALNFPYLLQGIAALVKPLFNEKMRKRIHITKSGFEVLHKNFDKSILPVTLGGSLSLEEAEDTEIIKSILSKENYYRDQFQYGYKN